MKIVNMTGVFENCNIKNLSDNRSFVYGVAMLMVILYHLGVADPSVKLYKIFYPGFLGVDIFMFMSGYGLCYSLNKSSLSGFYKRRFNRVVPIFLIMSLAVLLMEVFKGTSYTPWDVFCSITTFSFWHVGGYFYEWFLSFLIFLYCCFPLIYRYVEKTKGYGILLFWAVVYSVACIYKYATGIDIIWPFLSSFARVPIFMLGILCYLNDSKKVLKGSFVISLPLLLVSIVLWRLGYLNTFMFTYFLVPALICVFSIGVNPVAKLLKSVKGGGKFNRKVFVRSVFSQCYHTKIVKSFR